MWRTWRRILDRLGGCRRAAAYPPCLLLMGLAAPAAAELPAAVAQAFQSAGIPDSHVGLVVQPLASEAPRLAHGESRSLNPASVMKLVTTLAALDSLGPAHTFKTRVYSAGELRGDTLEGDLIIKGGGDPALTLERFWRLLREVRARGIRHVRGDVVFDQSCYDLSPIDPGAFDQSPLRPYNAPPAALLVDFNTLTLRLAPEGETARLWLDPPGLPIRSEVRLSDAACNAWRDGLAYRLEGDALRVTGDYPAACGQQALRLNLLEPERGVAAVFRALWAELGGGLAGEVVNGVVPPEAVPLLAFDSLPLARIAADVNEQSNNVMAKMLFLDLGALRFGPPATWAKGEAAIRDWLRRNALAIPELVLENGSGLSRIERISAASLARLLRFAAGRPVFPEFVASLPALGLEGTLKGRLADSPLAGRAWLKTGTLNDARSLAGYVLDDRGAWQVLVLLVNHGRAGESGPAQEALIEWTASPLGAAPEPADNEPGAARASPAPAPEGAAAQGISPITYAHPARAAP
ncbi:MAG: D-alanyl-D-alanine carboxypeptidase/D-alanyl-D-alanine-endopeptidase [Thiobacillaceae bacterium]|jgi:D-alanyl-D-alanine carboxypeptidase/D-alanyl-D-alanine-endopeptidase (penicillin-binding protein 4)|nr:D-alanyl-D-alanine carboxypeptidase/D-alanyl-D-alanine-endopeptidase [Thiobacillaceae bacterium]